MTEEKERVKRFNNPVHDRKVVITGTGRVSQCLLHSWKRRKANISLVSHEDCNAGRIPECGVLIHAGARVFAHLSKDDPAGYIEDNILGTYRMLEHVRVTIPRIKFVYISTIEAARPTNIYAATKASAEMLVHSYQNTFNIQSMVIRAPNLFLPEFDTKGYVGKLMSGEITEPREPSRKRQWLEGEDFANAVWIHLTRKMSSMLAITLKGFPHTDQEIADIVLGWKQNIRVKL